MDPLLEFLINMSTNSVYKGAGLIVLGLVALIFVWFMRRRKESWNPGFIIFTALSVFILLYGLFLVVFQPGWWKLPY